MNISGASRPATTAFRSLFINRRTNANVPTPRRISNKPTNVPTNHVFRNDLHHSKTRPITTTQRSISSTPVLRLFDDSNGDPRHDPWYIDIQNVKPIKKNPDIKVSEECEQVFLECLKLDVVEMSLVTQLMEERMGLKGISSLGGGVGGGGGGSGGAPEEEVVEEKTVFDLRLTGFDAKSKIKVIKEVRSITQLGLKDAKEMVEGAPKVVASDLKMEAAEELKAKLEAVGGTVEIV